VLDGVSSLLAPCDQTVFLKLEADAEKVIHGPDVLRGTDKFDCRQAALESLKGNLLVWT
jgi:hypothetical protein